MVFPKQNTGSIQNAMAEWARLWINCATDEERQHRAKMRLERLTSSDSVPCKCSYDTWRHNLSLAAVTPTQAPNSCMQHPRCDPSIGKQSGSTKSTWAACQDCWDSGWLLHSIWVSTLSSWVHCVLQGFISSTEQLKHIGTVHRRNFLHLNHPSSHSMGRQSRNTPTWPHTS